MTNAVSASASVPVAVGMGKLRARAVVGATLAPTAVWVLAQALGLPRTVPAHRFAKRGRSQS